MIYRNSGIPGPIEAAGRTKAKSVRAAADDAGSSVRQARCRHKFTCSGTAYGGDDERWHGEGRCYCQLCGIDGDG